MDSLHFVIVPEGDESDVEDLGLRDDDDDELNRFEPLPLPKHVEVFDYASELEELEPYQDEAQPSPPKKTFQTRSKCLKTERTTRQTVERQKMKSIPKWTDCGHMSVDPPRCDSTYSAPRKLMTPYQYFSLFLDKNMINNIALETNKYAQEKSGEDKSITSGEIEQYLGILLLTGVVKMPSFRMYWAAETRYPPHCRCHAP